METFNRNDHVNDLERILFELAQGKIIEKKIRKEYDKKGELITETVITTEKLPDYRLILSILSKLDPFYGKENDGTQDVLFAPLPDIEIPRPGWDQNKDE